MIGWWELTLVLFLVLILFGGKKLPELAKNLGVGIKEFRKASREVAEELETGEKKGNSSENER